MTLVTCSSYDIHAFKLFDTFRRTNSNDNIIWLVRDTKGQLHDTHTAKISKYFGNMTIDSQKVEDGYWKPGLCWYKPRWEAFYMASDGIDDKETVVVCDTFDVLFQKKLENYDRLPDDLIYCSDEGIKHIDKSWCMDLWRSEEYKEKYAQEPVYNAGVLIMNGKTFKRITMLMMSDHADDIGVDQHLLQHLCNKHNIKLANTNYIIELLNPKPYDIENGIVNSNKNIPTIVHLPAMKHAKHLEVLYEQLYPIARAEIHEYKIRVGKQYKPYLVGCYFSTKNRKERLWTALLSILTQSILPDYICIYNDGETYNMVEDYDMAMILRLALRKGVTIEYKEGDKKHQTYNHNRATYEMPTDYIIRLDDDGFAENNLVEELVKALNNDSNSLYSCATKWAHKLIPYDPTNKNTFDAETLEKNFLSTTEFDKEFTEPIQVGFLHGHCFAYKKDDKLHQPDWSLEMTVCEDTAFCLHATKLGKKLFVLPTTTYWHLQPIQTASQDNTKHNPYLIKIRSKDD